MKPLQIFRCLTAWCCFFIVLFYFGQNALGQNSLRIISLSPAATETAFALGLNQQMIGVTQFCRYPPAAKSLPRVGGLVDTNYEYIVRLKPDMVLLDITSKEQAQTLKTLNISVLKMDTRSITGILTFIKKLGDRSDRKRKAQELIESIKQNIKFLTTKPHPLTDRPKILLTFSRNYGLGYIDRIYVAGEASIYNEFLKLVGGMNAYQGPKLLSPKINTEALIQMAPDIIIELIPKDVWPAGDERFLDDWDDLTMIPAVKNKNIYRLDRDFMMIPGPRIDEIIKSFSHILKKFNQS